MARIRTAYEEEQIGSIQNLVEHRITSPRPVISSKRARVYCARCLNIQPPKSEDGQDGRDLGTKVRVCS
jgi:hypothetical protein